MAPGKTSIPAGLWTRCDRCGHMLYAKELAEALHVCSECGHHRRIEARARIEQLCDPGTFEEFAADLRPLDPLEFKDRMTYKDRIKREQAKTGELEAVVHPTDEAVSPEERMSVRGRIARPDEGAALLAGERLLLHGLECQAPRGLPLDAAVRGTTEKQNRGS